MEFLIDHWQFDKQVKHITDTDLTRLRENHWYHCQRDAPDLRGWLESNQLPNSIIDSFLAEDTRPMFEEYENGDFLLILRGVNLNESAHPEDMLSIRMLYFKGTLITTRKIPSKTVASIRQLLTEGKGPSTLADLVVAIIDGLSRNIDNYLTSVEDKIEEFDEQLEMSEELMETHKALFKIKRFVKPQLYAINDFQDSDNELAQTKNLRLRHSVNTITRINESLDFYLGELEMIKGELRQYHAEKMNQNTYLFTILAVIFLPTSFLTGLLGVNVGGMPGTDDSMAFGIFCFALLIIFFGEYWILRRLDFFKSY
ncbi:zinc transporter ZntB [Vibrio sp.]|uniref:Zinc transporter ZntB n=1 Tax=Vibrio viridaestus TaxID=2487322 RepID=A0A3N9TGZ0_9VIBR|nr:zinc transporter ZntB [Vibrio viridaestus]MDC0609355.1 zinc transporter ZntB [Vibrio sp.]RQW63033.1 zinc transporter ZntB [Vibrio viridaestus]